MVTQYGDHDVPHVLEACERMEAHLTAAGEGRGRSELIGCNWSLWWELLAPPLFTPALPCVCCVFAASPTQPLALLALPPACAVVSNDVRFVQHILGSTVNGTTYAGIRGRTTGAHGCTAAWLRFALGC